MADAPGRSELRERLGLLRRTAQEAGATRLVLRSQASLAWLLGARSHVPYTLDRSWFDVVIDTSGDATGVTVITNTIEAPRLSETELADVEAEWQIVPWWESRDPRLPTGSDVATDQAYPGATDLSTEVARVRRVLSPLQQNELRAVCHESAQVASSLIGRITPRSTEFEVAGMLAEGLLAHGMEPVTMLVAGGDRIARHRHPLPLDEAIGDRVTVVICGRRHGLISAVTRTMTFGPVPAALADAYERILRVESAFLRGTVVGETIGSAVAAGTAAYAANGFAADEWHRHHQGGFSGWESREYPASPASTDLLVEGGVVAWNPSGDGAKVEDTAIVHADGPELLVRDGIWPEMTVDGRLRPRIVEL